MMEEGRIIRKGQDKNARPVIKIRTEPKGGEHSGNGWKILFIFLTEEARDKRFQELLSEPNTKEG